MDRSVSDPRPFWEPLYFAVCILLIGFGAISILSIGAPFVILGTALTLRGPLRNRPTLFIAILIGTLTFLATAVLTAPFRCSRASIASTSSGTVESFTTCDSLLGFTYKGGTDYAPQLWPALILGMVVGVTVSAGYARAHQRRSERAATRGGH